MHFLGLSEAGKIYRISIAALDLEAGIEIQ